MNSIPTSIGRYDVECLLGGGGMGVLYLARDPVLDRHVALKLLRVDGEGLRRRFMREAQSAARLQHPNIVTVYDVGDHEGQLYIAMEYIDGDTLATLIRDDAPFSAIRKVDIIDEVADGLGFAHQRGIIHRDIKPANLMMSRGGLVKVLDFGIARVSHRDSAEIDAQTLIGTPAYMAPEQLEGSDGDARSDIYAVGLVMYEFFSGRRAFSGATTAEVLQKVLDARPIPIEHLMSDLDPDLCKVIGRAMARQPSDRYADLQALRKDLARVRRRVLQASGDDATVVVGLPVKRLFPQGTATTSGAVHPTGVSPSTPRPPIPAPSVALAAAADDRGLAHLAAKRPFTRPTTPSSEETIYAPVAAAVPPAAAAQPGPTLARATRAEASPSVGPLPPPPPPPSPRGMTASAGPQAPAGAPADEGPVPVPVPAVSSTGMLPPPAAGRATADAPVVPPARERTVPRPVTGAGAGTETTLASPPRVPVAAAPPPVAGRGVVQGSPIPGATTTRQGIPAAIIVGGLLAMLGICFIAAFLAVRSFGLRSGSAVSGLFTGAGASKVSNPPADASGARTAPTNRPARPDATAATTPGATEAAVVPPVTPVARTEPSTQPVQPESPLTAPTVKERGARLRMETPAAVRPAETPSTSPAPPKRMTPARQSAPARQPTTTRQIQPIVPSPPAPPESHDVVPPAVVVAEPPGPIERRQPDPPVVVAPTDEGMALVRAYVAARNTAHASGIRRVWPGVDDIHLRRITSTFSAPLTLGGCDIQAQDAVHASATCRLTQPGTTGTYAAAQGLTIRRTFVFDLQRQGGAWVIAGLRE